MTDHVIRHALPSDRDGAVRVLAEAFTEDPLWTHLMPSADGTHARSDGLGEFMAAEFDNLLRHGHVYVVAEQAAALWTPAGILSDDSGLGPIFERHCDAEVFGAALEHFFAMGACRPERPHFYLAMIGAADAARGRGLGTALLERVLDVCDREGILAHLESSNPRNVSLYERHGFTVVEEIEFAPGVVVRPMTREPRLRASSA